MRGVSGAATIPAEVSFAEGDHGFDDEALTDAAGVGGRKLDMMAARLNAGFDTDGADEANAPAGEATAVAGELLGQSAECRFEPAECCCEEGGIGHVILEGVNKVDTTSKDSDKSLGAELCAQWELAANDGTDMVFVEGDDALRNGGQARSDLALLVKDNLNSEFDFFERFEERLGAGVGRAEGAQFACGFLA